MIRSMTGFGRSQLSAHQRDITVEMKSVNHRYFEYSSRLPRGYGFLDDKLKAFLQQRISRGKVDVYVSVQTLEAGDSEVLVDHSLAAGYHRALQELAARHGVTYEGSAAVLSRYPDVLTVRQAEVDEDAVWSAVQTVTHTAVERFVAMRELEGERMRADVLSRADTIRAAVEQVEKRSPETVKEHMQKVETRIRELLEGVPVDEARLLNEAAVYADKVAVAEETVRLCSHLDQLGQLLDSNEAVGRKLDFLVQEMNRETNTIGSKCSDLELTRFVVDIKAEIEKIREQIQNIE